MGFTHTVGFSSTPDMAMQKTIRVLDLEPRLDMRDEVLPEDNIQPMRRLR